MVLRSVPGSFSSHKLLYTGVVHCRVEITGTRQVTAYFKVNFLNSLGETTDSEKKSTQPRLRVSCATYLTSTRTIHVGVGLNSLHRYTHIYFLAYYLY